MTRVALAMMENIGDGIGELQEGVMSFTSYRGSHRGEK